MYKWLSRIVGELAGPVWPAGGEDPNGRFMSAGSRVLGSPHTSPKISRIHNYTVIIGVSRSKLGALRVESLQSRFKALVRNSLRKLRANLEFDLLRGEVELKGRGTVTYLYDRRTPDIQIQCD